jgi:hypothetical protein
MEEATAGADAAAATVRSPSTLPLAESSPRQVDSTAAKAFPRLWIRRRARAAGEMEAWRAGVASRCRRHAARVHDEDGGVGGARRRR